MNRDVLVGILLVAVFASLLTGMLIHERRRGVRFEVEFDDGGNLKSGDCVYMQGVDVGEVVDMDLLLSRKVRVHVRLTDRFSALVPADSTFLIVNDKFIFGKKALLVVAPPSSRTPICEGQVVKGTEGYQDLILQKGTQKVRAVWKKLRGWVASPDPSEPDPDNHGGPEKP